MNATRKPIRAPGSTIMGILRSRQGWGQIDDRRLYMRSTWEVKFAQHLQHLKHLGLILEWEYEPQTFWFEGIKRGVCSYKPDFKITNHDSTHYWIEVKGYMDKRSLTKLKRFKKYFPKEELTVIRKDWFIKKRLL